MERTSGERLSQNPDIFLDDFYTGALGYFVLKPAPAVMPAPNEINLHAVFFSALAKHALVVLNLCEYRIPLFRIKLVVAVNAPSITLNTPY